MMRRCDEANLTVFRYLEQHTNYIEIHVMLLALIADLLGGRRIIIEKGD
jgi:hypothetical protein